MSKMKLADRDKGRFNFYFSLRAIASTIVGESVDSIIFFPLAFYIFPYLFNGEPQVSFNLMLSLMVTQVIAKTAYEIIALPITIRVVKAIKKLEGIEVYDEDVNYNMFKIKDL